MAYGTILNQHVTSGLGAKLCITYFDSTQTSSLTNVTATGQTTGQTYDATYSSTLGCFVAWVNVYDTYTVSGVLSGETYTTSVVVDASEKMNVVLPPAVSTTLDENSWDVISYVSANNQGANYWSVGDTKQITLNGTVGTVSFSNYLTWVYIIGFNHNSSLEGTGITFGTFKNTQSSGIDIALVDSYYNQDSTSGYLWFNISHNGNTTSGGWKGCDMRYNILGSTNIDGQDASNTTTTNPVTNTLMAALPSKLRSVMKPMTIYTDNVGGGTNVLSNVTISIDYLPLLAEFEILGLRSMANQYEQNYQEQYAYYANGNSKIKYRYNATSSTVMWWERSPNYSNHSNFCFITIYGSSASTETADSLAIAPIFRV